MYAVEFFQQMWIFLKPVKYSGLLIHITLYFVILRRKFLSAKWLVIKALIKKNLIFGNYLKLHIIKSRSCNFSHIYSMPHFNVGLFYKLLLLHNWPIFHEFHMISLWISLYRYWWFCSLTVKSSTLLSQLCVNHFYRSNLGVIVISSWFVCV